MIDRQALQYLVSLGAVELKDINGQMYSTSQIYHVKDPAPAQLSISTLTGLIDYIKADVDLQKDKAAIIHIVSPTQVKLYSQLKGDMARDCYISCEAITPHLVFEAFIDVEKFNILLQSCFFPNEDRDAILRVVGNLKDESVMGYSDDGVSQSVTARSGIAKVENVVVPNPVMLAPYRTFSEVEQPAGRFIFRMQSGPKAGLFEADGGNWRLEAMLNIKEYLSNYLDGCNVKIIA